MRLCWKKTICVVVTVGTCATRRWVGPVCNLWKRIHRVCVLSLTLLPDSADSSLAAISSLLVITKLKLDFTCPFNYLEATWCESAWLCRTEWESPQRTDVSRSIRLFFFPVLAVVCPPFSLDLFRLLGEITGSEEMSLLKMENRGPSVTWKAPQVLLESAQSRCSA